ncbi:Nitric oxide synthase, inducible [Giardia lamblia P15]|uniref:Nitric oxide synthase, inducible n=1 Tax=Giardia intestinalis (strain P15) TaxID=658858 RepID=E1F223_GIAIA|nr:Nitric oxide synthase, inducible [Giardia lamblia P15]
MTLSIVYATVSGTARNLAHKIATLLNSQGIATQLYDVKNIKTPEDLPTGDLLYLTSTHGLGQHPQSAQALMKSLKQQLKTGPRHWLKKHEANPQPLGSSRRIAVLGIGSIKYHQFCAASQDAVAVFRNHNIPTLIEPIHLDTSELETGLQLWVKKFLSAIGTADSHVLDVPVKKISGEKLAGLSGNTLSDPRITESTLLSPTMLGSFGWIYHLRVPNTFSTMLFPGAHIAIYPRIEESVINCLLDLEVLTLHDTPIDSSAFIQIDAPHDPDLPADPISIADLLSRVCNVQAKPSYNLISFLAPYATTPEDKFKLKYLTEDAVLFDILSYQWPTIYDFLLDFNSLRIPLGKFLRVCPRIDPRLYSVASLPHVDKDSDTLCTVDLLVGTPKPRAGHSIRNSLGPSYLQRALLSNEPIRIAIPQNQLSSDSALTMLLNGKTPLIGVAFGSGFAPFRAYHELRSSIASTDGMEALAPYLLLLSMQHAEPQLLKELRQAVESGIINVVLCLTRDDGTDDQGKASDIDSFTSAHGTFLYVYRGKRIGDVIHSSSIPDRLLRDLNRPDLSVYYCGPANDAIDTSNKVIESIMGTEKYRTMYSENRVHVEAY